MTMTDAVDRALIDEVLTKLGFSDYPAADGAGLQALYRAWCENVSFDNVQKRVYFGEGGTGPLPGTDPTEFLRNFLDHGTGGTCWPSSIGLWALLDAAGFDVRRVSGNMVGVGDFDEPNHGSTAVVIEDQAFLVDSSILNHEPIPLIEGEDSSTDFPLQELRAEWTGDSWRIYWLPGHGRDHLVMELDGPGLGEARSFDFWAGRSEISRGSSFFNDALYIRRSILPGIRTIGRGSLISIDPPCEITVTELTQETQAAVLVETFGLSEEVVERLPRDDTGGLALG